MFCFVVVLALAFVCNCQPQDLDPYEMPKEKLTEIHRKMDADKDGSVSLSEMMAFARSMRTFAAKQDSISFLLGDYDTNNDGKLKLREILEGMGEPIQGMEGSQQETFATKFKAADRNADGVLEADEVRFFFYPELHDEVISMIAAATMKHKDKNGDGKLTRPEFLEQEGESTAEEEAAPDLIDEDFLHADKNGDGIVDAQELKSYEAGSHHEEFFMRQFFETADKNNDKLLALEELHVQYKKEAHEEAKQNIDTWRAHMEL